MLTMERCENVVDKEDSYLPSANADERSGALWEVTGP